MLLRIVEIYSGAVQLMPIDSTWLSTSFYSIKLTASMMLSPLFIVVSLLHANANIALTLGLVLRRSVSTLISLKQF